ncbi:MAG: DUF4091 domain-containing protein [Rhodoferax sp.]|nr:DUF4091 domain-containing protein [Rhodoferax sp.]
MLTRWAIAFFLYYPLFLCSVARGADIENPTYRLIQSTAAYTIWTTTPADRVFPDSAVPTMAGSGIKVYAAKNEFEPFVVVIRPSAAAVVNVSVPDFGVGTQTELYQVKNVNVIQPSDALGRIGPHPDPLWPLGSGATVELTANANTVFWFSVHVTAGATSGDRTGMVRIAGVDIPVTLHVFNFAIPGEMHVETQMNHSDQTILSKYGVTGTGEEYWTYVDKIKQYFADHRLTPRSAMWSGGLSSAGGGPYIDYDCNGNLIDQDGVWGFEQPAARYLGGTGLMNGLFPQPFNGGIGFPSFQAMTFKTNDASADQRPASFCGQTRSSADWVVGNNPASPYNQAWFSYMGAVQRYLTRMGYLDKAYHYFANEPQNQEDYDAVAWYSRYLKQAAPGIKLMVSENARSEIYANANYVADHQIDIWLPVLQEFNPSVAHEREINHGEASWIYFLHSTRPPYFNPITLDHPGIESKLTGWFLWKYRLRGIAYYAVNDWSQNPWTADPRMGTSHNGDTFLLYPPATTGDGSIAYGANRHRFVPSVRFELMRDSLDDYEYLYLLAGGAKPVAGVNNAADDWVNKIVSSTASYTRDTGFMYNLRRLIGLKLGNEIATIPDVKPPVSHPRATGVPGNYYINFQNPGDLPATTSTQIDSVTNATYRFYRYNGKDYYQIGTDAYDAAAGYGWYAPPDVHWSSTWLANGPNPLQRSIIYSDYGRRATFEFDLPNGTYTVNASVGWQGRNYLHNYLDIEGINFVNDEPAVPYLVRSREVVVQDGKLTVVMGIPANNEYTMLNYLEIESLQSQTITFGSSPSIRVGETTTVSATASSGLNVTFTSLTTDVCTISGSTVTGIMSGTCTIAANQPGNSSYSTAPQVTQNIIVGTVPIPAGVPVCTLSASPVVISSGNASRLTANCTPIATSYSWTGGACVGTTESTCMVTPTATTTYTVTGTNADGTGTAASATVTVNACTYGLGASSASVAASASTASVSVTSTCAWTAVSNASWLTITAGSSGSGNATVAYAVAANTGTTQRVGTLTIAGQTFTVTQTAGSTVSAPVCSLSANPSSITSGGSSTLTATCNPAATSYVWMGASCSSTASTCTVKPTATTTYSVQGSNAGGANQAASATVTVTANTASYTVPGTLGNDVFVLTAGNSYYGGAGNDTFIISHNTLRSDVTAKIIDTEGDNIIQLVDGMTVTASSFYTDAAQLTLSNGAKVQILGASKFKFQLGANVLAGDTAAVLTYSQFISSLGASLSGTLPASGTAGYVVPTGFTQASVPVPSVAGSSYTVPGTIGDDVLAPSGGNNYLGGGGNDTYIISPYTLSGAVTAKIIDTEGGNVIQLVKGLTIASSSFYSNAVQLTLSNGASVQILGASGFSYLLGANAPAGVTASSLTYAQFAAALGASVPAGASAVSGSANFVVPSP